MTKITQDTLKILKEKEEAQEDLKKQIDFLNEYQTPKEKREFINNALNNLKQNENLEECLNILKEKEDLEKNIEEFKEKENNKENDLNNLEEKLENKSNEEYEKLAEYFEKIHGFQCYQIAIHRDEGHLNEKGEKVINHHAHMEFITLDKQTGKNNFRREKITPKALRQMQSEVAEILKMEHGVDKRKSGVKRIEPRAYAVLKEKEKKEKRQEKLLNLLSKTQYQQIIENFRKEQAGKGFTKEFFKDLSELKKNFQEVNETSLSELLNDILEKHREYLKDDQEKDFLKEQINSLEKENQILKKTIAGINNREELIFIEEKEIKTGKVDFLIKSLKQGLTNQVLKEHNHYEIKNNYEALKEKNQELELKLIGSDLEIKKRDDFINSLGRMLNFQGLNYNTPLNELERYLNQKEQKNDKYTNKIKKMDLKAI